MFGCSFGPVADRLSRPNNAAIIRFAGILLLEQDHKWALNGRCMSLENPARIIDHPVLSLPGMGN